MFIIGAEGVDPGKITVTLKNAINLKKIRVNVINDTEANASIV